WGMLNSLAETVATCTRAVGVSFATLSLSTAARGVSIAALGASIAALGGCGSAAPEGVSPALGQARATFVNGGDDRREYYELSEPFQRAALERFTVALMTDSAAAALTSGHVGALPTWQEVNGLCDGEPFAEQPAAAFCSGVLVD